MDFLKRIIERKKIEIPNLEVSVSINPSKRNFVKSVRSKCPSLIAEVKPKSPSAGNLIDRTQVPEIVKSYNEQAQAISVLCDREDFGGGYDLLSEVRCLTDLPVLAKEFIIDQKQILKARSCGADAVLLIAAVLTSGQIIGLANAATMLGMGVLLELHEESEITKIPDLPVESLVIGVNNRNLSTLKIDLSTTERLIPLIQKRFSDHVIISESGISSKNDIERLSRYADGFLIGTSLLKTPDLLLSLS